MFHAEVISDTDPAESPAYNLSMRLVTTLFSHLQIAIGIAILVAGLVLIFGVDKANAPTTGTPSDEGELTRVATLPGLPPPAAFVSPSRATTPSATPITTPTTIPSTAAIERLQIPAVAIDAPVVMLGVESDGVMQAPHTPTDVGWYDFSGRPGQPGNAVFAAHVDYVNYGAAVFYRLKDLDVGDIVIVSLEDGSVYSYEVVSSVLYDVSNAPVQEIVGPTENETMTLITCAGAFNQEVLEYNMRLVVRAERSVL